MKDIFTLLIILFLGGISSLGFAQGYAIFPQENVHNLSWMATEPETDSFFIRNRKGEEVRGYVGDFVGNKEAEVIKVTKKFITIQTIEIITKENGEQYEKPSRMKISTFGLDGLGKGSM